MGNVWTGVSDSKLVESEKRMLKHSGIDYEHFEITNVPVDNNGNYVRTY